MQQKPKKLLDRVRDVIRVKQYAYLGKHSSNLFSQPTTEKRLLIY